MGTYIAINIGVLLLGYFLVVRHYKKRIYEVKNELVNYVDEIHKENVDNFTEDIKYKSDAYVVQLQSKFTTYRDKLEKFSKKHNASMEDVSKKTEDNIKKLTTGDSIYENIVDKMDEIIEEQILERALIKFMNEIAEKEDPEAILGSLLQKSLIDKFTQIIKDEIRGLEGDNFIIDHIDRNSYSDCDGYHLKRLEDNEVKILYLPTAFYNSFDEEDEVLYSNMIKHCTFKTKEI